MSQSTGFRLLTTTIGFRAPTPLVEHLTWLFAGSATDEAVELLYEVTVHEDGSYRLAAGNHVVASDVRESAVADTLLWALNRDVIAAAPSTLLLHAAAVESDRQALVVLGASGSGKSTLTAALVQAGWGYLTDEAVLIDPMTAGVMPYAKPIGLKRGSHALLPNLRPDLHETVARYFGETWYIRGDGGIRSSPVPVAGVVVLDGPSGEVARVTHLPPSGAMLALADHAFRFAEGPHAQLDVVDRLARRVPAWRLGRMLPEEGCAAILDAWNHRRVPSDSQPGTSPRGSLTSDVKICEGARYSVFADDAVLVSPDGTTLMRLDAQGSTILELLLAGHPRSAVTREIATTFNAPTATIEADVSILLDRLGDAGMVEVLSDRVD